MANGDGDQSKRPALNQHDSDSQVSDQGHQGQHGVHHHRHKASKHVVGGTGGRLHARVPSSKGLHKTHGSTTSAKLNRRQASISPDRASAFPPAAASGGHRRATSDLNLSRDAPATNPLKKNSSHNSLKRNRSKVEVVGKKSKSSTNLKSHGSSTAFHNHKHGKGVSQVHFNLGDDDDDDEENQEDEWVDASTSASPLLSRRTSVVSGGPRSTTSSATSSRPPTASEQSPQRQPESPRPKQANGTDSPAAAATAQHNQYITSRILERTPAQGAPPKMSAETVSVRPPSSRAHSPTSDHSSSPHPRPGSSGKQELTSRFVTNSGGGSGSGTGPDSFTGALARAANGRLEFVAPGVVRRPKSMGNLAGKGEADTVRSENGVLVDDDDIVVAAGEKRQAPYVMNRTQQKINLQRASSSLEPTIPAHHPALAMAGMSNAAGPMQGAYGRGETALPRLLERTGMEYLVVRRYQNPIARSLARLAQVPGQDKKLRIASHGARTPAHSRQGSELRGGSVQSLRERDARGEVAGLGLIGGRGERRPGSRRGYPAGMNGGASGGGDSLDEQTARLSGSSLIDGDEDATTLAVLRNLWDKNMDLSASQE